MVTELSLRLLGQKSYTHKKDDLKPGLLESMQALQTHMVDMWYLHAPDVSKFYIVLSIL